MSRHKWVHFFKLYMYSVTSVVSQLQAEKPRRNGISPVSTVTSLLLINTCVSENFLTFDESPFCLPSENRFPRYGDVTITSNDSKGELILTLDTKTQWVRVCAP